MNAYLILQNQTRRLRFSTAQLLLKEGLARIHQYYPLTLTLKTNEKPSGDLNYDAFEPECPTPIRPLTQKKCLQEFA